jgi:hypothetical protein
MFIGSSSDLSEFEQLEAERFDLPEDPEHSGAVLERPGEHGLAAPQLTHHRGKGGHGSGSEPAPYPDRVEAGRCVHANILKRPPVSRRRRNLVIVRGAARAAAAMFRTARLRGAADRVLA